MLVVEGAARAAGFGPADHVRVVLAPGSGDDAIVAEARRLPGRRLVLTADRELRRRCESAGAAVTGPGWLLGLLTAVEGGPDGNDPGDRRHRRARP